MTTFSSPLARRERAAPTPLRSKAEGRTPAPSPPAPAHVHLRASLGNQTWRRLLESGTLQAKLAVSQPRDPAEVEADRVAEQVTSQGPATRAGSGPVAGLMRKCDGGQEEEDGIQRKATAKPPAARVARAADAGLGGTGHPLPGLARTFFEPRLGRDLAEVRVHTDAGAGAAADAVGARAFTLGRDIAFAAGEYAPDSAAGRRLLAHELAHVVQNDRAREPVELRRQIPNFVNCTEAVIGPENTPFWIDFSRLRALEWVNAALGALPAAPPAGSPYEEALARHFIAPTPAQRSALHGRFTGIQANLAPANLRCSPQSTCTSAITQAEWRPATDRIHICRQFWNVSPHCGAIILIHEAAHDAGVDVSGTHRPNRGTARYPLGNTPPAPPPTTAQRMNNCDAFAYFAHHVRTGTDLNETCFA